MTNVEFTNGQTVEPITQDVLVARVAALDADDRQTLGEMTRIIVETLGRGTGTVLLIVDVHGSGQANIIAGGNAELVIPLLYAGAAAANVMAKPASGVLQ